MQEIHRPGFCVRRALAEMGPSALILDHRIGDVAGEGCPQDIYLLGLKPAGPRGIYCTGIQLAIAFRCANICVTASLPMSSGYDPRLVLHDLTGNGMDEMVVHVFSNECGGRDCSCVYSYAGSCLEARFDYRLFNRQSRYRASRRDEATLEIRSDTGSWLLPLEEERRPEGCFRPVDIRCPPAPVTVEPLSLLVPCPPHPHGQGGLLAVQPVHAGGRPVGVVETYLRWNGLSFTARSVSVRPLPLVPCAADTPSPL